MLIGTIDQVSFSHGETKILNQVYADIPKGACIAIVGANGAGKTTLLSLLAGETVPTSGRVNWHEQVSSVTYFKQEEKEEGHVDWEKDQIGEYRSKWQIPRQTNYEFASGGERMKMRLSATLAEESELVLLDEPTNHLDGKSVEALIELIQNKDRTYLVVSHDRYFIDQVADFVFEIEDKKLTVYGGNYTKYQAEKERNREIQQHQYEQQQGKIKKIEEQMDELQQWSEKAHKESRKKGGRSIGGKEYFRMKAKKRDVQVRSKERRLSAELEKTRIEKPSTEKTISFDIKGKKKKGKRIVELESVSKKNEDRWLFKDVAFTIQAGERIALIGSNGAGKSTLFRMLFEEERYEGRVWRSEGLNIGYLSQTVLDLPENLTMEAYFHMPTFEEQGRVRSYLANLGFSKKHWELPLSALSMGERVKVKLMQFILNETDVLVLDEPTNHLDLPSREELEKTLETFQGTLLFASHDRYFTERMAEGLLVFEEGTIHKVPLSYEEWKMRQAVVEVDRSKEEKLVLETELQAVLGELSMLQPNDKRYAELDVEFHALTKKLRDLK